MARIESGKRGWRLDEAPMSLIGFLLFFGLFVPAVLCGTATTVCFEIILHDLRRLPQGLGVKYPRMSWNYYKMIDMHKQHFPGSRVPVVLRFCTFLGMGLMAILGLVGLIVVFSKSVSHLTMAI
jgi:hypothetical protein